MLEVIDSWNENNSWVNHKLAQTVRVKGECVKDWDLLVSLKRSFTNWNIHFWDNFNHKKSHECPWDQLWFQTSMAQSQVQNAINKRKKALHALNVVLKFFNKTQLLAINTANYYSILYYDAEVWLLPTLKPILRQQLFSAFPAPLKLITTNYNYLMAYASLHYQNYQAAPKQITLYKHALLLHRWVMIGYTCTSTNNLIPLIQKWNSRTLQNTKLAITFKQTGSLF